MKETEAVSLYELNPRAVLLTMAGVLIALFISALDQTIVATALPSIAKSLGGVKNYSGVISAYLIASTAALPIGGKLSDLYGRKRFLIGGMAWFVVGSALCGMAATMVQLILFRALKGIGAGVMQAAANTTIADLYPPIRRGKAIGLVSTVSILANMLGPLLGGYLTDGPGWRYVFYINLPVGILGCLVVARFFPTITQAARKRPRIDYLGALALVGSVVPLLLALDHLGAKEALFSCGVAGLIALSGAFLASFLWIENHAPEPLVPLPIFCNSIISLSLVNCGLGMICMFSITIFAPLFLQSVLGLSAKESGAVLIPLSFTFSLTAVLSGFLVSRIGRYKALSLVGALIALAGVFWLSRLDAQSTRWDVLLRAMLAGFGLGLCLPLYNIAVQNAADLKVLGVATSMVYFSRFMSTSLGMAVFGAVIAARTPVVGLAGAIRLVYEISAASMVAITILTLLLHDLPLRKTNAPSAPAAE